MHKNMGSLSEHELTYIKDNIDIAKQNLNRIWKELQEDYDKLPLWKKIFHPSWDVGYGKDSKDIAFMQTRYWTLSTQLQKLEEIEKYSSGYYLDMELDIDDVLTVEYWATCSKKDILEVLGN